MFCLVDRFPCDVPESQPEAAEIVESYQSDRNVLTEMVVHGSCEGVGLGVLGLKTVKLSEVV